jgi:PAS domain-containing protein
MNFSADTTSGEEGVALFGEIRARHPDLPVILLTAWTHLETAVELVKAGAADYLASPGTTASCWPRCATCWSWPRRARARRGAGRRRARASASELAQRFDLRGWSLPIRPPSAVLRWPARSRARTAGAGHRARTAPARRRSPRSSRPTRRCADGPFVTVNCGALPAELIEAELFGAEAGAYTGAGKAREGKFEAADGGTLFLDEIGNLPPAGQMKLLRVLETGRFERLGSNRERQVKVRVISATNADLPAMIRAAVPRGSVLPAQRDRAAAAAAGRAAGRHPAAGRALPAGRASTLGERCRAACCAIRLAGQRARAAQHDAARALLPPAPRSRRRPRPAAGRGAVRRRRARARTGPRRHRGGARARRRRAGAGRGRAGPEPAGALPPLDKLGIDAARRSCATCPDAALRPGDRCSRACVAAARAVRSLARLAQLGRASRRGGDRPAAARAVRRAAGLAPMLRCSGRWRAPSRATATAISASACAGTRTTSSANSWPPQRARRRRCASSAKGLVQRELLLDTMVQNTPVAMLLVDSGGRVVHANIAARKLLGEGAGWRARSRACSTRAGGAARGARARRRRNVHRRRDDNEDIYHLSRRRVPAQRPPHELLLLRQLTAELRRQEVQTWKKVIRVISHELNNSLAPIASLAHSGAELLRRGQLERLPEALATIEERARHLDGFIRGYARFAKLPAPRVEAVEWPVSQVRPGAARAGVAESAAQRRGVRIPAGGSTAARAAPGRQVLDRGARPRLRDERGRVVERAPAFLFDETWRHGARSRARSRDRGSARRARRASEP